MRRLNFSQIPTQRWWFALLAILTSTFFACISITLHPTQVAPIIQAPAISAPLQLCPAIDQAPDEIRSKPGYLQIVALVSDASGKPIIHLKQSDFDIHRAGKNIQTVYFHEDPAGLPASIAILIDSSGSMKTKLPKVQISLAAFLKVVNQCDEVAIVSFDSAAGVKVLQSFTTDHALIEESLAFVKPDGQTPLYDAIHDGLQTLKSAHYSNRVMILITDGIDDFSAISKAALIAEIQHDPVPIYIIGVGDPKASNSPVALALGSFVLGGDAEWVDVDTLDDIAFAASGRAFIVPPPNKDGGTGLDQALASISDILANAYIIGVIAPSTAAPDVTIVNRPTAITKVRIAADFTDMRPP